MKGARATSHDVTCGVPARKMQTIDQSIFRCRDVRFKRHVSLGSLLLLTIFVRSTSLKLLRIHEFHFFVEGPTPWRLLFDSFQLVLSLLLCSKASFGPPPSPGVLAGALDSEWNHSDPTSDHPTWPHHCFAGKSCRRAWWDFAAVRGAQRSFLRHWLCNWSNDDGGLR